VEEGQNDLASDLKASKAQKKRNSRADREEERRGEERPQTAVRALSNFFCLKAKGPQQNPFLPQREREL